ncbi:MAG: hypothetical protein ACJA1I_000204 [Zhongshania marina]
MSTLKNTVTTTRAIGEVYQSSVSSIALHRRTLAEIDALKKTYAKRYDDISRLRRRLHEARNEIGGMEASIKRSSSESEAGRSARHKLQNAESEVGKICERISDMERQQDDNQRRRDELLLSDQNGSYKQVDVGVILHHQAQLHAVAKDITRIDELIAAREADKENSDSLDPRLEVFQTKRGQLLAEIALGEASQSNLDELDSEVQELILSSEESEAKAITRFRDACQAIAGLQEKRKIKVLEFDEMKSLSSELLSDYFRREIGDLSAQYSEKVQEIAKVLERILAISRLADATGSSGSELEISGAFWRICLPSILLNSESEGVNSFTGTSLLEHQEELIEIERDHLLEAGIDLITS